MTPLARLSAGYKRTKVMAHHSPRPLGKADLVVLLLELAAGCPLEGGNPLDCPLHAWRAGDDARSGDPGALSEDERFEMYQRHLQCLRSRQIRRRAAASRPAYRRRADRGNGSRRRDL